MTQSINNCASVHYMWLVHLLRPASGSCKSCDGAVTEPGVFSKLSPCRANITFLTGSWCSCSKLAREEMICWEWFVSLFLGEGMRCDACILYGPSMCFFLMHCRLDYVCEEEFDIFSLQHPLLVCCRHSVLGAISTPGVCATGSCCKIALISWSKALRLSKPPEIFCWICMTFPLATDLPGMLSASRINLSAIRQMFNKFCISKHRHTATKPQLRRAVVLVVYASLSHIRSTVPFMSIMIQFAMIAWGVSEIS